MATKLPSVLWCGRGPKNRHDGWSFPPRVRRHLIELTAGKTVCQLFGGRATFGVRLDIDPVVRPHVIGDAWVPPFKRDAFDFVILDPPYIHLNQQEKLDLLRAAAWIAKESIIWFHTTWISGNRFWKYDQGWLVRVGNSAAIRCIQVFAVSQEKQFPQLYFTRGPAIKYNRWNGGQYAML